MLTSNSPDVAAPLPATPTSKDIGKQFLPRASPQHLAVYFGQMRAMLHAGIGLISALDEMSRTAPNGDLRRASATMRERLGEGRHWSEAMKEYPTLFSRMTVSLIAAGEKSGNLAGICAQLSQFAEQEYKIRQLYNRETWYPKVLLFFSVFVFPFPIAIVFFGTPYNIGPLEQMTLFGGGWLAWWAINWFWPVTSRAQFRLKLDRLKLRMPIVKEVAQGFAVAKVWRVMALLYDAGVSLPTALRIAAEGCGNAALAERLRMVPPRLERGEPLSSTLASTGEFPQVAIGLVQSAEQTGNLDKTLSHSVRFLELDAETKLIQAAKVSGKLFLLLIAFKIALQVIHYHTGASLHIGGGPPYFR